MGASRKLGVLLAAVLCAVAGGCGGDGDGGDGGETASTNQLSLPPGFTAQHPSASVPPNIVTDDYATKEAAGSARRALLDWWQAVQFRDVITARELTSDAVLRSVGPTAFRRTVLRVGDGLPGLKVVNGRRRGETTIVRAYLVFAGASGATPTLAPRSFEMRSAQGSWKLASIEYLVRASDDAVRAARTAERSSGSRRTDSKRPTATTPPPTTTTP